MNPEIAHPEEHVSRAWPYQPTEGFYDEMVAPDGSLRPHWRPLIESLEKMGEAGFARRWQEGRRLILLVVDGKGGSLGMKVSEVADLLIQDYGVLDALNLDGGGSTSLAMETGDGAGKLVNVSMDGNGGRKVGSSLAVFLK